MRQLHNAVEHAVAFCESEWIEPRDLPRAVTEVKPATNAPASYKARVEQFTSELIQAAVTAAGGNHAKAARSLGLTASYVRRRVGGADVDRPKRRST